MPNRTLAGPRRRQPELELESRRSPALGYESAEEAGFVRCLEHGFPTPLARWHYHDEYELHLIVATSGKAFVGDWIGQFQPGHLVLTGPRVPHNWISLDVPEGGVALRDRVLQFHHEPIERACHAVTDLGELIPVLERARYGVEFFGLSRAADAFFDSIKHSRGLERFGAFCEFMAMLARCTEYRMLSSVRLESPDDSDAMDAVGVVVEEITRDGAMPLAMADFARRLGMTESRFSRFFRRATGNNFIDFVNRVRVSRACVMLMESDRNISDICYDVGFNNIANFNRRFRAIKGVTPSEFRRQADRRFGR